jgi:hypothetical protein
MICFEYWKLNCDSWMEVDIAILRCGVHSSRFWILQHARIQPGRADRMLAKAVC